MDDRTRRQRIRILVAVCLLAAFVIAWQRGMLGGRTDGETCPQPVNAAPAPVVVPVVAAPDTQPSDASSDEPPAGGTRSSEYPWAKSYALSHTVISRIPAPAGFIRISHRKGTFAYWLRRLPLRPGQAEVTLYNGKAKDAQDNHHAILDIDTGKRDLQRSAGALIRLRSEFLFQAGKPDRVHFRFTNGELATFTKWSQGYRPTVARGGVYWRKSAKPDTSYESFRKYLDTVFSYTGTLSLGKELHAVRNVQEMQIGDVFIQSRQGNSPGHAVIVIDMAVDPRTNKKVFLLGQGNSPAQNLHILLNKEDPQLSPWYSLDFGEILHTPEWSFPSTFFKRFGST